MKEELSSRNAYLEYLEQTNPGYIAYDDGREIVLNPVSRASEAERQAHQERLATYITDKVIKVEQ